ncbi:phosphonate C-P lyase system protein PhnH [Photobacterium sanctipauli]|uniref:Phosphonate C-P lyase system protein PhnH n=1 Tax=Photobacterium sanctipauli TaxID=1342794 RepID=A0A2T3NMZ7_9GAMM|nr:phosphonate C-P lyase system protein PhnH [Photobacterium sanctipauli]PSW16859.1 phosphonate C-P lyase system protein PhnH [Photobacterium sanctipauli]
MSHITSAFKDAVHDSQACFRRLLTAMSEPGRVVELDRCHGFGEMMPATSQVLLAMADNSTPLWLSAHLQQDAAAVENIHFHTGASTSAVESNAAFAVISQQDLQQMEQQALSFNEGDEEYPDRSTTVIIETDSVDSGASFVLSGPGIKDHTQVQLGSLPAWLQVRLCEQAEQFPLGLDFIFVSGQQAVAIPRSTSVEVAPCM